MSVSQVSVPLSVREAGLLTLLLPVLAGTVVERADFGEGLLCLRVRAAAAGAPCPGCGTWCTDQHDTYRRRLRDLPAGGRRVLIWLTVRVLRCLDDDCPRETFAEQPGGLASPYARRTPALTRALTSVAGALAGSAGSRLARRVLLMEVSRHTLIRLVMSLPDPPADRVRVLGIDDFSLRRGQVYATLMVDMETGQPVEVLPDREAATVEAWLREHPGVEIICRDRGTAYAEAARDGAPDAIQVADRWHLWHNLCEHAARTVARHKDCLGADHCQHQDPDQHPDQEQDPDQQGQEQEQDPDQQGQGQGPAGAVADLEDLEAIIRDRHARVHELRAAGQTLDQAAAGLGLTSQTASRYWRAASPAALLPARATSALDPWKPCLHQRAAAGITSSTALYRELTALGCTASYSTVYAYTAMFKLAAPPRPPAPPGHRQVTRQILTDPGRLDPAQAAALAAALDITGARCPQLGALAVHVTAFAKMLTRRQPGKLDAWLDAADADDQPDLHSFTAGIRQDYQAVRNALTYWWNSGLVEGHNTRVKLIKRQMYGRATLEVLRKFILIW